MRDVVYLDQIEQAEALLKPQRIEVLRQLAEPRSCTEVAVELDQTPRWVYYHVKRLLKPGLVRQVAERRVRGIHEGIYQAAGRSYWLSPSLVGRIGLRQTRDRLSLGYERTIRFAGSVEGVESTVQFELAEDEDGTLMTLSHSDLPSFADVLAVSGLGRLAGRPRRAAPLPRTAAVARD